MISKQIADLSSLNHRLYANLEILQFLPNMARFETGLTFWRHSRSRGMTSVFIVCGFRKLECRLLVYLNSIVCAVFIKDDLIEASGFTINQHWTLLLSHLLGDMVGREGGFKLCFVFQINRRKLCEENFMSFLYVINAHCRPREAVCHAMLAYMPYSTESSPRLTVTVLCLFLSGPVMFWQPCWKHLQIQASFIKCSVHRKKLHVKRRGMFWE